MSSPVRRLGVAVALLTLATTGCASDTDTTSDGASETTSISPTTTKATSDIELQPYTLLNLTRPDGSEIGLADPSPIKIDGTWYLYGTSSEEGFEMWSSTDLETWTYGGVVWRPTPGTWQDHDGHGGNWAPEVHVRDNGIWMYYTAKVRIGVARADSPEGPFIDQLDHPLIGNGYGGVGDGILTGTDVTMLDDWDDRAWDAFVHESEDGSLTMYFSAMTPFAEIRAIPMIDDITVADVEPTVVVGADGFVDTWEAWVREGPAIVERDGTLHLMYSGNAWGNGCYAVGVATAPADSPLGPFTRRADNPILTTKPGTDFYGPGHNSVVEGPNGDLLAFFHRKLNTDSHGLRSSMYAPLTFDERGDMHFVDPPNTEPLDTIECREPAL